MSFGLGRLSLKSILKTNTGPLVLKKVLTFGVALDWVGRIISQVQPIFVGNGQDITLWENKWLNGESLRSQVIGLVSRVASIMTLSNLNTPNPLTLISFEVPYDLCERIQTLFTNKCDKSYSLQTNITKFDAKKAASTMFGRGLHSDNN